MKVKLNKGWQTGFLKYYATYGGLLVGKPTEKINQMIIDGAVDSLSKTYKPEAGSLNIIKHYNDYSKHFLLPICTIFKILKHEPMQKCYVITFANESDSPEDIMNRTIENHELNTVEWDY